ncbi:hypothetical protein WME95_22780 [Sorangium sp. So ce327]|uniref:hypothetical protein n=1 Tax=Sorangium sp. So ce327 TaxID=3133301 RepID=UPI003F63C76F
MEETSGLVPISTRLKRIAGLARQLREQPLTTLAHRIDLEWLREAHRRTRKDGAMGVDGQSADDYAAHLEDNLRSLLERANSHGFRPGRSAQQALDELHREAMRMAGGWVIEIDIRKYWIRSIEAIRQVGSDAAPGQDPASAVRAAGPDDAPTRR